jgi:serine/threonine-protein kinase HipA
MPLHRAACRLPPPTSRPKQLADFRACAKSALMKRGRAEAIVEEVRVAAAKWPDYAEQAKVVNNWRKQIQHNLRLDLLRT